MAISDSGVITDAFGRESKAHGTLRFPVACYEARAPFINFAAHWHEEFEFCKVLKGSICVHVGGESFSLCQGEGLFINANVLHQLQAGGTDAYFRSTVFHPRIVGGDKESCFQKDLVEPVARNGRCPELLFSPHEPWQERVLNDFDEFFEAMATEPDGYELTARQMLSELLFQMARHEKRAAGAAESAGARAEASLKRMLEYVHEHYSDSLELDDLAGAGAVSKSGCIRLFRRLLDVTPMDYVGRYRLQMAAGELLETDWSVTEIAARCGFAELGYFARVFRRLYGATPSEYRRKGRTETENRGGGV